MIQNTNTSTSQFYRKWVYLFSARFFPIIVLFIITILFSRKLTYSEYGIFQSIWMYINIINVAITFGFTSLILSTNEKFLSDFIKRNIKKIILFYGFIIFITFLIFFFCAKNLNLSTLILLFSFALVQNLSLIKETQLIKSGSENKLFLINLLYAFSFLLWHLYIIYTGYNINKLIIGIIILTLLKIGLLSAVKLKTHSIISIFPGDEKFQKHWLFTGINDSIGVLSKWIDKIFLLYLLTPDDFAIFFNGSFEIPFFGLLITIAGNLLMVNVSKNIGATDKILISFKNNFKILSAIVFPIFFFLLFNTTTLFALLFGHKYDGSIPIFLITIFILPIRINNYGALLQCFTKGNKMMFGSILDIVVVLILMFLLYPIISTKGVAIAVVVGTYIQIIYYLVQSSKILKVSFLHLFPLRFLLLRFLVLFSVFMLFQIFPFNNNKELRILTEGTLMILSIFIGLYKIKNSVKL